MSEQDKLSIFLLIAYIGTQFQIKWQADRILAAIKEKMWPGVIAGIVGGISCGIYNGWNR